MRRALGEVVSLRPGDRRVRLFKFDVRLDVVHAGGPEPAKYVFASPVAQRGPVLLAAVAEMSDGDDRGQRVPSRRRHRRIEPCRSVDVEAGIRWEREISNDVLEVLAVIIGEEERVRTEHVVRPVHAPEEAYG